MKLPENKDRFFESYETEDGKKVYTGNMKPLGHAFMTPRKKAASGIEYGFAPESYTDKQLQLASISLLLMMGFLRCTALTFLTVNNFENFRQVSAILQCLP